MLGRVVVVGIAAAAALAALLVGLRHGREIAPAGDRGPTFGCPMHPQVVAPIAGECPICGMALTARGAASGASADDSFSLPARMPALLESDLVAARRRSLSRAVIAPAEIDRLGAGWALLRRGDWQPGQRASYRSTAAAASQAIEVRLAPEPPEPAQPVGDETFKVRFDVVAGAAPREGDAGWLSLPERRQDALTIPAGAVLDTPVGAFVFVASANRRTFVRRRIETGRLAFGLATVVSGLRDGETVAAVPSSFAAERQLDLDRSKAADRGGAR
jgi:hypothetical protein